MVQITTTTEELKEFVSVRSNHIILITGLPGSGKNYLCSVLVHDRLRSLDASELDSSEESEFVLDLDRIGYVENAPDGRTLWKVDVNRLQLRAGIIVVGICDNYSEVLAKVASFREITGTPVVFIYSIPEFQLFTQAHMAKAKWARESKNPFAEGFQSYAELDREAVAGTIQRKLGLLALAITTAFAPELYEELDSSEDSPERYAVLARKFFGPLDKYESLVHMCAWISSLTTVAKLTFVAHLNKKASAEVITDGWHKDEVVKSHELSPIQNPTKGGDHGKD